MTAYRELLRAYKTLAELVPEKYQDKLEEVKKLVAGENMKKDQSSPVMMYGINEPPQPKDGSVTVTKEPDFKEIEAHVIKRMLEDVLRRLRAPRGTHDTSDMGIEEVIGLIKVEVGRKERARRALNKANYELEKAREEIENLAGNNVDLTRSNELLKDHIHRLYVLTGGDEKRSLAPVHKYEATKRAITKLKEPLKMVTEYDREDLEKAIRIIHRKLCEDILSDGPDKTPLEEVLEDIHARIDNRSKDAESLEEDFETISHYLDGLYRMTTDDYEDNDITDEDRYEAIKEFMEYYADPGIKPVGIKQGPIYSWMKDAIRSIYYITTRAPEGTTFNTTLEYMVEKIKEEINTLQEIEEMSKEDKHEKTIYILDQQVDKFRNEAMYLRNRLEEIHDIVLPDGDKGLPDDSIANVIISRVRYLMHPRNAAEWKRIADFRRTQLEVVFKKLLRTNPTGLSDDDLSQDIIDKIDALLEPQLVQIKGITAKEEWSIPKKAQETLDWLTASLREIHSKLTGLPEGPQTQLLMRQAVSEINAEIDRLTHPQVRIQDLSASEEVERRLRDDIHDIYCITMGLQPDAVTAKITTQDAVKDIKKEAERKNIELKDYRAHIHRLCEAAGFKIDGCIDDFVTSAVEEIEDLQNKYDTEGLRDSFQEIYETLYNHPSDDDDTTTFHAIIARIRSLQMDRVHGTKVDTYPEDDPAEQAMLLAEKWCAQALEREVTIGVVHKKLGEVMRNLIAKGDSPNSLLLEQIINFSEPREE